MSIKLHLPNKLSPFIQYRYAKGPERNYRSQTILPDLVNVELLKSDVRE